MTRRTPSLVDIERTSFASFFHARNLTDRGGRMAFQIQNSEGRRLYPEIGQNITCLTEGSQGTVFFGSLDLAFLEHVYGDTTGGTLVAVNALHAVEINEEPEKVPDDIVTTSEKITILRAELSLSISDLASVLKVERPTIYSWIEGALPHEQNRQRLDIIFPLALYWKKRSNLPLGDLVKEPVFAGQSIVELLARDIIPIHKIEKALINARAKVHSQADDRESKRQMSVRQMRAKHGISKSRRSGSKAQVDVLSGKRVGPD